MNVGIPGADSTDQITNALIEEAAQMIGATPQFWGRYFCCPTTPSPYEYIHLNENGPLVQNHIKLLPIAEQTWRVAGSQEDGVSDARGNVDDLIETFSIDYLAGIGHEFLMFLDVEGSPPSNPSLSAAYYAGWAQTLSSYSQQKAGGRLTILPAVYASRDDTQTWQTLQQNVALCHAVWIAAYGSNSPGLPAWDASQTTPQGAQITCPILAWQYAGNMGSDQCLDCNVSNPSESGLLERLITPP
jgi:hypothetical protein